MPDNKHPHEPTPEESIPLPTHPSKQSRRDYSALPQKPITLKREVASPPALKRQEPKPKRKAGPEKESIPKPKPKSTKTQRPDPPNPWRLLGISPEAEAAAMAAAQQDGIAVGEWLKEVILQRTSGEIPPETGEVESGLAESLKSIDERLDRLENQRGFWIRFWDRFMEQR